MTVRRVDGFDDQDAIGIDREGDKNLSHTCRPRGNTTKSKRAERAVVLCHIIFTLEYLDFHLGLVVV